MAQPKTQQTRKASLPRSPPGGGESLPLLQGQGRRGRLQNLNQLRRYISEKGKIRNRRITGACRRHRRQIAVAVQAGARDGAPALRGAALMEVILLSDVDKVGLRGEVVNVARGYARNFLLPRRLAEPASPGRVAELEAARRAARPARGSLGRAGERDRRPAPQDRAQLRRQGGADGRALRLGDDDRHRRRALAHAQDPRRPEEDRHRLDPADRPLRGPIKIFEDVSVDVKTLVVPEGGELPLEELAAMEAAEAAAEAAKGSRGRGAARRGGGDPRGRAHGRGGDRAGRGRAGRGGRRGRARRRAGVRRFPGALLSLWSALGTPLSAATAFVDRCGPGLWIAGQ